MSVKTCCSQRSRIQLGWGLTVRRCRWGWQSSPQMRSQILQKARRFGIATVSISFALYLACSDDICQRLMQLNSIRRICPWSVMCTRDRDITAHLVQRIAEHEICNYVSGCTTLQLVIFLGVLNTTACFLKLRGVKSHEIHSASVRCASVGGCCWSGVREKHCWSRTTEQDECEHISLNSGPWSLT